MPSQKVKAVGAQYTYGEPRISLDTYAGAEDHLLHEYQKKAEGGCPTTAKRDVVLVENIWEGRDVVEGWGSLHPWEGSDAVEGWCSLHPWMLWRGGVPHIHDYLYYYYYYYYFSVQKRGEEKREGPVQLQMKSMKLKREGATERVMRQ